MLNQPIENDDIIQEQNRPSYIHPDNVIHLGSVDSNNFYRTSEQIDKSEEYMDNLLSKKSNKYCIFDQKYTNHLDVMINSVINKLYTANNEFSMNFDNLIDSTLNLQLTSYIDYMLREEIYKNINDAITKKISHKIEHNLKSYTERAQQQFNISRILSMYEEIAVNKFNDKKIDEITVDLLNKKIDEHSVHSICPLRDTYLENKINNSVKIDTMVNKYKFVCK